MNIYRLRQSHTTSVNAVQWGSANPFKANLDEVVRFIWRWRTPELVLLKKSMVLLVTLVGDQFELTPGTWLLFDGLNFTLLDNATFAEMYLAAEDAVEQDRQSKSKVYQPQWTASDASQGNVATEKGAEPAKPRYLVRFIPNVMNLQFLLNSASADGYEFVDWGEAANTANTIAVILRRRD